MGPVLGVEGGGSHRHAVVAETSSQVLGIEAAPGAIRFCVREAIDAAGLTPGGVERSCSHSRGQQR